MRERIRDRSLTLAAPIISRSRLRFVSSVVVARSVRRNPAGHETFRESTSARRGSSFQGLAPLAIDYRPLRGLPEALQKNEMLHVCHAKHCYAAWRRDDGK